MRKQKRRDRPPLSQKLVAPVQHHIATGLVPNIDTTLSDIDALLNDREVRTPGKICGYPGCEAVDCPEDPDRLR